MSRLFSKLHLLAQVKLKMVKYVTGYILELAS